MSEALRELERRMPEPDTALAHRILAEVAIPRARRRLWWRGVVLVTALLAAGVVVAGLLRGAAERRPAATPPVHHHASLSLLRRGGEVAVGDEQGIWAVEPATGRRRLLVPAAEMGQTRGIPFGVAGRWSPDGTRLAVATAAGIFVKEADRPARLVPDWTRPIVWSPDGSALLVQADDGRRGVLDAASLVVRTIPAGVGSVGWWFDGGRSVLSLTHNPTGSELSRLDVATWRSTIVWRQQAQSKQSLWPSIAVSPDASELAVLYYERGQWRLDVVDRRGTRVRTVDGMSVSRIGARAALIWSPDGTRLAVRGSAIAHGAAAAERVQVWIVAASQLRPRLAAEFAMPTQEVQRSDPAWSPDGTRLALVSPFGRARVIVIGVKGTTGVVGTISQLLAESWEQDAP